MELLHGFQVAFQPVNLLACFVGALLGTLVGVLPGLGCVSTMALLIPLTYGWDPTTGLIMLAGIYYGAMYGGSTTAILVNVPGESPSVVTALDGYKMARKGRAGAALAISAIGSFVAGTLGVVGLQLFAPPLGRAAVRMGPPEYCALCVLGFLVISSITSGSARKAFMMVALGVLLGLVGMDPVSGESRYTLGKVELLKGIDFVPVAIGLFGMAEVLSVLVEPYRVTDVQRVRLRDLYPTREEFRRSAGPIARGSILGFLIGLIPGPAAVVATFLSYAIERRLSPRRHEFGQGAIEGVAGPESANNAASVGAMVPLLALGIPFAPATAMLLGGLMIHGIHPGPRLISDMPELFWGLVASMYLGNVMLVVLNLPLVGLWARLTRVSPRYLMPVVVLLCIIGTYSVNNSLFDVFLMVALGLLGYFLRQLGYEPAPLVLGLVIGPFFETSFRQSLLMFEGNLLRFFLRPGSGTLLALCVLLVVVPRIISALQKRTNLLAC